MSIKLDKENHHFNISIAKNLNDIRILRSAMGAWLEDLKIDEFKIMSVNLCLTEAIYNAMLHAYKETKEKDKVVDIKIKKEKNFIEIIVQDYGKIEWFKNYKLSQLKEDAITQDHGKGLLIVNGLASTMEIKNDKNKGTWIHMRINL
ncbi:MAG: ATP-binding protein [Spirochaetes bacterium]|nr:ATP-binding protein [Spirochaetota bacterium]